ncbi:MAG: hypothetical protein JEZ06_13140 [Anaerolineaceae bacterium]|nr:hypothetical protein [Anaerolineaceae bacterium]
MEETIKRLLESEPWVVYQTRLKLLDQSENHRETRTARQMMLVHPKVQALIEELADWPGVVLKRHNDAKLLIHKLVFAADLGITKDDDGMPAVIEKILEYRSPEGMFQVIGNIHPRYGGSGQDQPLWMLCDSPSIVYALAKFGLRNDPLVKAAAGNLENLVSDNGWPCVVEKTLGKFRGPGKAADPCPYATLICLKALSEYEQYKESQSCKSGVESILNLWEHSREQRPYLFKMGNNFRKLKLPYIWYDILHVLEVLSRFSWARNDPRLLEMRDVVFNKVQESGQFQPESIWMAWKGWDFGQKKAPSSWMSMQIQEIMNRFEP